MKLAITVLILTTLTACDSLTTTSAQWTLNGHVTYVQDGDSLLLSNNSTETAIRLRSIDSPELDMRFGNEAKEYLRTMIEGRNVTAQCYKKDIYEREVCTILIDEKDVNDEMIIAGYAWWYSAYQEEQTSAERAAYSAHEKAARNSKIGLWFDENPIAPWDYRRTK